MTQSTDITLPPRDIDPAVQQFITSHHAMMRECEQAKQLAASAMDELRATQLRLGSVERELARVTRERDHFMRYTVEMNTHMVGINALIERATVASRDAAIHPIGDGNGHDDEATIAGFTP